MNERIAALRQRALSAGPVADPSAGKLREASMAETAGEAPVIREAKAVAHCYRNRPLVIHDGELIVGDSPHAGLSPEQIGRPTIMGRQNWQSPWPVPERVQTFFKEGMLGPAGNHTTLDYEAIFAAGFQGLLARVEQTLARRRDGGDGEAAERDLLTALKIVAEGYIDLSARYADHALELAGTEPDVCRRRELEMIAANCRRVPARAPTTFWEACQCAWFAFFYQPDAPGRLDQYLYPFYERDISTGTLTRDAARELLSCLWLKYFSHSGAQDGVSARHHLTLGGVKPDGSDASNELSYLCLEVTEQLRLVRPQVGLRCHHGTPLPLLKQAVQTLRSKTGMPDLCNDEQIVPALVHAGVAPEDARDFSLSGCHEVIVTGKAQMGSVEGFINLPMILRLALGLEPHLSENGDLSDISDFDQLWRHITESMDMVAQAAHEASIYRDRIAAGAPSSSTETSANALGFRAWADTRGLLASLVTRDCIENGHGYFQGGARYNFCNWDVVGLANLADSLAAIRRLVFDEKAVTLEQLVRILATDWEGHEPLRLRINAEFPHFGNDDDTVDALAAQVIEQFSDIIKRRTPFRGGEYILGTLAGGENMHVEFGRITAATPDGRRAGESFADSIGAAHGRDRRGVTAMLNSVAKLPHRLLPTAVSLNVKLDPKLLDTEQGIEKIAALIQAHFASGGQQMQFNLVNRQMLLDAKRDPERHADLMVRVAGYSAPFLSLWDDLQDEIIARTEHEI